MVRTPAQFVSDWLKNLTLMIPLLSALGLSSIYGNSQTAKNFIHGKPEPIVIEQQNYDLIINQLLDNDAKQLKVIESYRIRLGKLEKWHE